MGYERAFSIESSEDPEHIFLVDENQVSTEISYLSGCSTVAQLLRIIFGLKNVLIESRKLSGAWDRRGFIPELAEALEAPYLSCTASRDYFWLQ